MAMYRQSLQAIRRIVLTHCRVPHPDLALLARELGCAVRAHGEGLDALARRLQGPSWRRLPLPARRAPHLQVALVAWPADHTGRPHDHEARWGLEVSLHGALEIEAFRRDPLSGEPVPHARHWLGPGDALWFDVGDTALHRWRNLSRRETALTLQVIGRTPPRPAYLPALADLSLPVDPGPFAGPLRG